jgi:hypothetical protein
MHRYAGVQAFEVHQFVGVHPQQVPYAIEDVLALVDVHPGPGPAVECVARCKHGCGDLVGVGLAQQ